LAATLGLIGVCGFAASQLGDIGKASNATAAIPAGPPLSLTERVLAPSAIPGMVAMQQPTVVRSAAEWATTVEQSLSPARETARLRALGYVAGVAEQLHSDVAEQRLGGVAEQRLGGVAEQLHGRYPVMAEAISVVEHYRSPASARAELAYQYAHLNDSHSAKFVTFPVGIPYARGVSITGADKVGLNVMFADGPNYYVVGAGAPSNARNAPTRAQLISAAGFLYLSINGCVARADQPRAS
jgi:hypothetical protein